MAGLAGTKTFAICVVFPIFSIYLFPLKILLCPCRYFAYLATILIICYIQRDASSYREKSGLETAVVHGGLMCEVVADDEPGYVECGDMPVPHINFMKVDMS